MNFSHNHLNLNFNYRDDSLSILNIALEEFTSSIPLHCHGQHCYEIHYVAKGEGTVNTKSTTHELKPGVLYITGPHTPHEQISMSSAPLVEYSIFFKAEHYFPEFDNFNILKTCPPSIHEIFKYIFKELKSQKNFYQEQITLLIQLCLNLILRELNKSMKHPLPCNPTNNSKIFEIDKIFLYEYKDITLDTLSKKIGFSNRQTQRFLKEYYGKTFLEKRTEARMSSAALLLKQNKLTLEEIAFALGYSSSEYFSSCFKKYFHITPGQYRLNSD